MPPKHTKGPWYFEPAPDSDRPRIVNCFNERWHRIASDTTRQPRIADVRIYGTECEGESWLEAEANTRLIAAAPELLEMLQEMMRVHWADIESYEEPDCAARLAWSKAEALIDKIKGA